MTASFNATTALSSTTPSTGASPTPMTTLGMTPDSNANRAIVFGIFGTILAALGVVVTCMILRLTYKTYKKHKERGDVEMDPVHANRLQHA